MWKFVKLVHSAKKGQSSIHKFPGGATVKKNVGKTSGWGGRSSIPMVFCVLIFEAKCQNERN